MRDVQATEVKAGDMIAGIGRVAGAERPTDTFDPPILALSVYHPFNLPGLIAVFDGEQVWQMNANVAVTVTA